MTGRVDRAVRFHHLEILLEPTRPHTREETRRATMLRLVQGQARED